MPNETAVAEGQTGFRLYRFEVLNWGTFDRHVWKIEPEGNNSLLTGDIGSGKSTLVDALTTLLVPAQRITYNQAAGAERRERNLSSYVRGYYKSEKEESHARPVSLRGSESYSVLLGYFRNEHYGQDVTLAQVFWTHDEKAQPERFYVVADRPLFVDKDFCDFGKDISGLKKKLRKEQGVSIFDAFVQYAQEFRRRMEIRNNQALDLFYQTVSMKSVGNLTEFVRIHMLEEPPVGERLEEIRRNFDNLNRAHEAVKKAKAQIGMLEPLVQECDDCLGEEANINDLTTCRKVLDSFFAEKKKGLLEERISKLEVDHAKLSDRMLKHEEDLNQLKHQRVEIQKNIDENGGNRLSTLSLEVERLEKEKLELEEREKRYARYCSRLDLETAGNIDDFHLNKQKAEAIQFESEEAKKKVEMQRVEVEVRRQNRAQKKQELERELESLRNRPSNIPVEMLDTRRRLCEALSLKEEEVPFAGELIQVKSSCSDWEGAIERLLRSFGLSLLVPEGLYSRVAQYVNQTHLGNRLVYFRMRDEGRPVEAPVDQRMLLNKVDLKPDSRFNEWLEQELIRRFDYVCCETLEDFHREAKALTKQGQTKSQGRRYEKDDRFRLEDKSRYVLGWNTEAKIRALLAQHLKHTQDEKSDLKSLETLEEKLKGLEENRDACRDLLNVREFREIDWRSTSSRIADLLEEKKKILQGSNLLRTLQTRLGEVEDEITKSENALKEKLSEKARVSERLDMTRRVLEDAESTLKLIPEAERLQVFPKLETMRPEALGDRKLAVESCDSARTEMREWLQGKIDAAEKRRVRLREGIVKKMENYKAAYPLESRETDANWEASDEFRAMLKHLQDEDLPRHETRFKKLLNEGTINDIVLFQSQLEREQQDIRDKIALINRSLREIEYNTGTYIELVPEVTVDSEIREFKKNLRDCLGEALAASEGEFYNEKKFFQVKEIVDRFNGREGYSELDQKWTKKVTDVRNWFEFLVHERLQETGEDKEIYSDSSGKSGGQKEKLAYTILASALAYQFGLNWGESHSKAFRFVMIDEAFGRGSDESARYALELFKKLNLQLLIVTPLQKIHVIEDYVRSVHFVYNQEGKSSKLQNLSIEAYRENRARYQQQKALS